MNKNMLSQNIDNTILKSFNNFAQSSRYGSQDLSAHLRYDNMHRTDLKNITLNKTIYI